jgi:MFS transporter, DHA1 family, inner membrane transport protein
LRHAASRGRRTEPQCLKVSSVERATFPLFKLLVITGAIFVSVSSEFLPTGILPEIASDLTVSESQVGLLVTIFAFTVALTATPLTALTTRFSRKPLMITTLAMFAAANVLAAIAPSYEFLIAVRIAAGLAHGVFWAVAGPYAARLVAPNQLNRAISITNAGGTFAFILGIPFGTAIGHALGWRLAFGVMAGIVVIFTVLVLLFLPDVEHRVPLTTGEIGIPAYRDKSIPAVLIACLVCVVVILGQNIYSTYQVLWLTRVGEIDPSAVGFMLLILGICGAIGLTLAGWLGDLYPRIAFWGLLASTAVFLVGMWVFQSTPVVVIIAVIGWGISFGGLPALLQGRVISIASHRVRDLSSSALTTAFNIAIGGGALIGGVLLDTFGVGVLPLADAVLAVLGLGLLIVTDLRRRHFPQHQSR